MSFYLENTTKEERDYYEKLLVLIGSLSNLFSNSKNPYLASRITENLFCRCLKAENLSRSDITADARKGGVGIGIKTWTGSNLQKIAEFNSQKPTYEHLDDEQMILRIAELRNERISFTMRAYGLSSMIYHCTIREKGIIKIVECPLVPIDVEHITNINRKKNVITFTDGINKYSFNTSKSTLYKDFSSVEALMILSVKIYDDPFSLLEEKLLGVVEGITSEPEKDSVYLPLYSFTKAKGKYIPDKNGLNLRFAGGRERNPYEVSIRISSEFNRLHRSFFPPRDTAFELTMPNGAIISAKVCQDNDKALMSNPNKVLGHWLIDDVLKISPDTHITYDMLENFGVDSVKITKQEEGKYSITFAKIGSYDEFMGINSDAGDDVDEDDDSED